MYHIIVNPSSRTGKGIKIWKNIIEPVLLEKELPYHVFFSKKTGDVARLTREILRENPGIQITLLLLGGDGTVNEAIQGITDFSRVKLGYIPTGSSNDLARDLQISSDPLQALEAILSCEHLTQIDIGKITYMDTMETRLFSVSSGIGFDAAVCEEVNNSKIKNHLNKIGLGKLVYLGIALKQLLSAGHAPCTMTLDQKKQLNLNSVFFIASMIHKYEGGGFMFCPEANDEDGIFDICCVNKVPKFIILLALPTAFWGKHYFVKGITAYKAKEIYIKSETPLWIHTDGEVTRKAAEIQISCLCKALTLIR